MTSAVAGGQAARLLALGRAETFRVAMIAALPALALVLLVPTGGDVPAHLYRTLLVREGVYFWDNLWFAGQYPLVSYSLLYYLPAALVGNVPLVLASVVASAMLFTRVGTREWGAAALWPSRVFALLAIGPLFTGTYSYALGFTALLGTLAALQSGRTWLAVACAALTLGFSPLAFVFLVLVLAALLIVKRGLGSSAVYFALGLAVATLVEVAAMWLFPSEGRYPFRGIELLTVLFVSTLGAALALRARHGSLLAAFFGLWAGASLIVFLVPDPVGENLTRMRSFVFPLMLLAALLAGFRPRALAIAGLAAALAYNVVPYASAVPYRADTRPSEETFWAPAVAFLRSHATADYRVEVVPTYDHWEAYWIPREGFALARGWYRQLDLAENRVLYRNPLAPGGYRSWLRRMGVRYVLLPRTHLGQKGAGREAELLRSGRVGLRRVHVSADWRIWELPNATPILTGPAPAHLTAFRHERIAGEMSAPGLYKLRVKYMPYWRVQRGSLCLERTLDGMTRLRARRAGRFILVLDERPSAVLRSRFSASKSEC
jgi:hypothetical protein